MPRRGEGLSRPGPALEQMDLIEVNEAFAPQYLAVKNELALNREKVNVNGGAIAFRPPAGRNR